MSTPPSAASRLPERAASAFAADVADFLTRTPRELPSRYLYDSLGSSLFEAICRLPWYRIADVEQRLLHAHAPAVHARAGLVSTVVELGPGSGRKLITLLAPRARHSLIVHLIDVSAEALDQAGRTLGMEPGLTITRHQATYEDGLAALEWPADSGRRLVVFLGSNIGNFDAACAHDLLHGVRRALRVGDLLLLGADLVKPEAALLLAYDDPLGVTAAFNRNLLVRVNRELGGDFNLEGFRHRAVWNAAASRVEMHLVSLDRQRVRVPDAGLDLTFEPGETIWTESSYKYRADDLEPLLGYAGFRITAQWVEDGFALTLGEAV